MPLPLGTQIAVNILVIAVDHTWVYAILTKEALYLLSYISELGFFQSQGRF